MPAQGRRYDQADHAQEFKDAERHPDLPRQCTEGRDVSTYLVKHKDLHDARRRVQDCAEDLQYPQQDVQLVCSFAERIAIYPESSEAEPWDRSSVELCGFASFVLDSIQNPT